MAPKPPQDRHKGAAPGGAKGGSGWSRLVFTGLGGYTSKGAAGCRFQAFGVPSAPAGPGPFLEPFWDQNGIQSRLVRCYLYHQFFDHFLDRFLIDFGTILGRFWDQNWYQNGGKMKMRNGMFDITFLIAFWIDF